MANADKNLVIIPNTGTVDEPQVIMTGADATTGPQVITLRIYHTNGGTISIEGSAGQLLSISNNLTGTLYSVNDVSGIPSIEVLDTGLVKLAQYGGNLLIGTGVDDGVTKVQIAGGLKTTGAINGLSLVAAATGFTIAGGTTSKTLTVSNTLTLAGTDSSTLNIGAGGTLGSAAFTASSAYATAAQTFYIGTTQVAVNRASAAQTLTGISIDGNAATVTSGVYTTGSYADPAWITSLAKSKVGLGSVENTALSTWAGSTNITTLGTIASGTWSGTAIADNKIASALTGKTYNGLTLTAAATGFTVAGGTTSKTLTVSNTLTLAGTDASTLNIGAGGTLGSAAFTASSTYATAAQTFYIGTTQVAINRTSATITLTGVSIDGSATTINGITTSQIIYGVNGAGVTAVNATQNVYELGHYKAGFWHVSDAAWAPTTTGWYWGATFAHASNSSSYNFSGQLAFQNGSGGDGIYGRTISNGTPTGWSKLLSSGNYNSYAPTLTGTGASGTWGISITGSSASTTGNAATVTNGVYTTGSYADPTWITSLAKSKVGLGSVENTALSTWAGSANITTVGTIATGTWNGTVIADGKIATALTGKTYNGLTLTAAATGFTVAGGTTSKTLTVSNTLTLAGTDTSTLNIGAGGTLGSAAFTASSAYATAAQTFYIGTTQVAVNRASAAQSLTGITSIDGSAATLTTARTINGVSFNGSANIVVPTIYDSAFLSIQNPGGAQYSTGTPSVTGAIAIVLPVGMTGSMVRMTIQVYEYVTNESFTVYAGGYNYGTGNTWANQPFAYIVGNPGMDRRFTVRFGYTAGGKGVVYIGELASTWAYPQVFVTDVQLGYGGQSSTWTSGWSISFQATAFENVTATITNSQVGYATSTNTTNAVVLRDGSGNFTAGTITAALSGNASTATTLQTARTINGVSFNGSANITVTANTTTALTFNNGGAGVASGTTFDGSTARTISYNTLGAQPTLVSGTNIKTINGTTVLGSGDLSIVGGITYTKYTANVTATDKQGIIADTTAGTFTVTLPASPTTGMQVIIADGGDWSVNNLTVGRNAATIEGVADDLILNVASISVTFLYNGTTWKVYVEAGVTENQSVADQILAVAGKTTPVTGDLLCLLDSADSNNLKQLTYGNLKTTLQTAFDSVYASIGSLAAKQDSLVSGTNIKTINSTSILGSGNLAVGDVTLTGTQTLTNKTLDNCIFINGYTEETATANTSTAYTIDFANGSLQILTLTGNCTFTFPSPTAGKSITVLLKQDATGSRTATWPASVKWPSSTAPTLTATANKGDKLVFTADGTYWWGSVAGLNYL